MQQKVVLLKEEKKIFEMKVKPAKHSKLGELDIIINSGKGLYFDHVILGDYFREYKLPDQEVNSLSWHGYYENCGSDSILKAPVVHIKSHGRKIDKVNHLGSINMAEPIAIPVCSIYVPNNLSTEGIGSTKKQGEKNSYIDIEDTEASVSSRYDFFILPKEIPVYKFKGSPLMCFYKFADLELFNSPNKGFNIIRKPDILDDIKGGTNGILVRLVRNPADIHKHSDDGKQIFHEVSHKFSLIINDPNDIYNKMAGRNVIEVNKENKSTEVYHLKDAHEDAINFKPKLQLKIWDGFGNS
ncbi:hypothetical protein PRVXH_000504 [Proteinivorax hydrogeniformans]|uniref:Uncharacterized protein n=1 Tax=Proteinivorax hydrogeniformans TaxID=1826727 RepID=A0AAU8HUU7_9FIRM